MSLLDFIQETRIAISANKVRSGLTILGIVIGISSVIAMISIGTAASSSISTTIESLGSNLIQITPGAQRNQGFQASAGRGSARTLIAEDADTITANVSGINAVAYEVSGRYQITAKGTNTNTTVDGVTSNYTDVRNVAVSDGVFISDSQIESYAKVAVLGPTTMTDLFGTDADAASVIGQSIRIKGMEFKVIGVTASKGGSGFGGNRDDIIYIP
ncbi:MAG: ABC transporter permease, partial [Candidatus Paceibacterota bacterium]